MEQNLHHKMTDLVNIPLQEREINVSQVTQIILTHILPPGVTRPHIFHLDIAYEVQEGVDYFLFNLLILGCITDKAGYVWRHLPRDMYLIETMPIVELIQARKGGSASYVHHVFDYLPFLTCRSPQESLDILINRQMPRDFKQEDPQFDLKEFTSPIFQMPYQYLSRLDQGCRIDDVDPSVPWGTPTECLKIQNGRLPKIQGLIEVISEVLAASQDFMRQQQDECSFVSLRDVERVLNVMSWFYAQSQEERTLFNQMDEITQPFTDKELYIEEEEEEYNEEEMEKFEDEKVEVEEGLESEEQAPICEGVSVGKILNIKWHCVQLKKRILHCILELSRQLLPTASDAGQCAYSVLEFLFHKQNEFLDNYNNAVNRRVAEMPHVKVRDITPAHLISYDPEQDILPLVLANCNYSFEVGKGTTVQYNFTNLERQIMDRFLFGKSWIDIEIELMVYRAEYTNATVFRKLQEKIPQEPLSTGVKHKICEEFCSLPDLCQALNNLDIAVSFLKSIGGNRDNNLDKFMVETLKMEQSLYSPKAKQICQYRHAQSLWLLLSLEKNKKLALHNQMIFDGLPEQFHQQLSAKLTEQVMTFLQPLSLERLELLLELMFECTVLVISIPQNPDDKYYVDVKEKKFKDYLLAMMTERELELSVELDAFPNDVLSKFSVDTWTLTYQCLQEKKRQRY